MGTTTLREKCEYFVNECQKVAARLALKLDNIPQQVIQLNEQNWNRRQMQWASEFFVIKLIEQNRYLMLGAAEILRSIVFLLFFRFVFSLWLIEFLIYWIHSQVVHITNVQLLGNQIEFDDFHSLDPWPHCRYQHNANCNSKFISHQLK